MSNKRAVLRINRHIGNGERVARYIFIIREALIQDIHLAFGFHCEAVNGILDFHRGIGLEMPETTPQIGARADLPEKPGQAFCPRRSGLREEHIKSKTLLGDSLTIGLVHGVKEEHY